MRRSGPQDRRIHRWSPHQCCCSSREERLTLTPLRELQAGEAAKVTRCFMQRIELPTRRRSDQEVRTETDTLPVLQPGGFSASVDAFAWEADPDPTAHRMRLWFLSLLGPQESVKALWARLVKGETATLSFEGLGNAHFCALAPEVLGPGAFAPPACEPRPPTTPSWSPRQPCTRPTGAISCSWCANRGRPRCSTTAS